ALVGARLQLVHDVGLAGSLVFEVPADHCGELLEGVEDGEVERREKVEWKNDPAVAIDDEGLHDRRPPGRHRKPGGYLAQVAIIEPCPFSPRAIRTPSAPSSSASRDRSSSWSSRRSSWPAISAARTSSSCARWPSSTTASA